MLILPRVKKGFKRALTGLEKAQKVIAAVTLGLGIGLATVPATDAQASTAPSVQQPVGSLVLAAPSQPGYILAQHESHSSHASHASHASHYSSSN